MHILTKETKKFEILIYMYRKTDNESKEALLDRRVLLQMSLMESLSYIYNRNFVAVSVHRPACCIRPNIVQACQSARGDKSKWDPCLPSREVQDSDFPEHRPISSDLGQTALQVYGCTSQSSPSSICICEWSNVMPLSWKATEQQASHAPDDGLQG